MVLHLDLARLVLRIHLRPRWGLRGLWDQDDRVIGRQCYPAELRTGPATTVLRSEGRVRVHLSGLHRSVGPVPLFPALQLARCPSPADVWAVPEGGTVGGWQSAAGPAALTLVSSPAW